MVIETRCVLPDRVKRLKEDLLQTSKRLSCERLLHFMQSWRETEEQPIPIRRAKAFEKVLEGMSIFINENPIVGTQSPYLGGVQPYPEFSCEWMIEETDFASSLGRVEISEADSKLLREAVDYWRDKCILHKLNETWAQKYGGKVDREDYTASWFWIDIADGPLGRISVDFGKVLNKGLSAIIEEAKLELEKLPLGTVAAQEKRDFLNAVVIACNAAIKFARRYAFLAKSMVRQETNLERKRELERIAETCEWVPARPARSFYEAIQSFWFIHLLTMIENCANGHSPGRFSQYMYPFYKKDKEEGRITEEQAIELLELLFIKFSELGRFDPKRTFLRTQGTLFQNLSFGGITPKGKDATNEVDFLVLEAQRRVRMIQPTLSILYHDNMSEEFLLKAAEVVRTGIGMPAFFNSDLNIQRLLDHGSTLEDARNHAIIGCVEAGWSHCGSALRGGYVNMPKLLELALNNGRDPATGKQMGLQTGKAEDFQSYDELNKALMQQLQYIMTLYLDSFYTAQALNAEFMPVPFTSSLVDDCIKNGKDVRRGGARYSMDGSTPVGTINLANSLAAIKKLVFEEKRITMRQLLEALRADFAGYEDIHRMLLDTPKYGNDDNYVDEIAREWYDAFYEEHQKRQDALGRAARAMTISVTSHFPFGTVVGALPSGRKAHLPLADGSASPEPGTDKNGPAAVIRSAAKVIDTTKYGSSLLNMKFHPTALATREGLRKLIALIKTYFDMGGHHVQFNVVSADTLRNAQLHPEEYQDLIVRVAGFSAFFIHLDKTVQNEIIRRTELVFE